MGAAAPRETRTTCPYCGVGCGVIATSVGGQIVQVRGDPAHPANFGRLCTKGSNLHLTATPSVTRSSRLLQPMRRIRRSDAPVATGWDDALDFAANYFATTIREHGPDAVGFYISGQLLTEDYYVFNKLAKGLIGTNNVDTNSRLCMSSAVAGYKQTLGADAPPSCYEDIDHAQCIFITGSNTAFAHPVLFRRIEDAKEANPNLKIVVCDPRRTDTAAAADLYLPIQPGTDVALFNGMLHTMLWEGWTSTEFITQHTNGFAALRDTVRDYTPDWVAQVCGISKNDLLQAARLFATSAATLSLYCQGLNQSTSGTAKNAALINLHLACGHIGRPGAGPFSLTGQPNAMGGREVGGLANLLSAHRDLANPQHRAEVAALWGVPEVPSRPGKSAIEMFQAAADGEIRALWIACTNPAQSMPDQATVRRALERAEFVVVQEAFATTATCDYADLLLPATTWGEKEGTVTNSERTISRVRAAVLPPGSARHDWSIATDFAQRLEKLLPGRPGGLFNYANAESVWNEHRETTRGRDLDITGLSYVQLEASPQQWPFPQGSTQGARRLYTDNVFPTADGRAVFANTLYQPAAEPTDARYPFALTTGRLRDHWHGMSRTGTVARLFGHVAEPALQMNGSDMERRNLRGGDLVHVTSRRGSIIVAAQPAAELSPGHVFMAMHWGPEYLGGSGSTGTPSTGVNALTNPAYCPASKQPELKHSAVKVLKAELPWSMLALAWLPEDTALATREALKRQMPAFAFAACVPFGRERTGVLFRAAGHDAPDDTVLEVIEAALGVSGASSLRYVDVRKRQRRVVQLAQQGEQHVLNALLLAGDTSSAPWMQALLQAALPVHAYGRRLLQPGAQAPTALQPQARQICTCFNVTDRAITDQLRRNVGDEALRLARLQQELQCGTNCGSCLPELRRMVRAAVQRQAVPT